MVVKRRPRPSDTDTTPTTTGRGSLGLARIGPPSNHPFLLPQRRSFGQREELVESSTDDERDSLDMGELSDTASSVPSDGRPTTPSKALHVTRAPARHSPPPTQGDHLTLALKAERILGLTPGTLPHAKACLEHARDEVRRTAEPGSPAALAGSASSGAGGMRGRIDRAKKSMSVALTPNTWGNGVVLGAGGKDEEERRERRRRANDGVIYWQNQVMRLEAEEASAKR